MIPSEMKDDINNFLKNNAIWIAIAFAVLILVVTLIIIFINKAKKNKIKEPVISQNSEAWLTALGGKENILEATAIGSRVNLKLQNKELVNKDSLKELGVKNIMEMSDKIILVVENQAENILKQIQ